MRIDPLVGPRDNQPRSRFGDYLREGTFVGIFSKTIKSIFLDDRAKRASVHRVYAQAMTEQQKQISARDAEIERLRGEVDEVASSERQKLIEHAMKVRGDKAKILDDLSEEDKQRLYAIAQRAMLGQDTEDGGGEGGGEGGNS